MRIEEIESDRERQWEGDREKQRKRKERKNKTGREIVRHIVRQRGRGCDREIDRDRQMQGGRTDDNE